MNCTIYNNQPYYEEIRSKVDDIGVANQYTLAVNTDEFKKWLSSNHNTTLELLADNLDELIPIIKLYVGGLDGNLLLKLNATVVNGQGKTGLFNNDASMEREAIDIIVNTIIEYEYLYYEGKVVADAINNVPLESLKSIIVKRLSAHNLNDKLTNAQREFNKTIIDDIEGDSVLFNIAIELPIVKELSRIVSSTNSKNPIGKEATVSTTNIEDKLTEELEQEDQEESGFYKSWSESDNSKLTLSNKVKRVINSLPYLNSTTVTRKNNGVFAYDINTNSYSGLPKNISADSVKNLLLHKGDFTNKDSFLNSIKLIAESYGGPATSLIKLYNILTNDEAMLISMYNNFNKVIIDRTKQRFSKSKGSITTNLEQSNPYNTPSKKLFVNVIKSARLMANNGIPMTEFLKVLVNRIPEVTYELQLNKNNNTNTDGNFVNVFADKLSEVLSSELGIRISPEAIRLFMTDGGTVLTYDNNKGKDIYNLFRNMAILSESITNSKSAYRSEQIQLMKYAEANNQPYTWAKFEFKADDKYNKAVAAISELTKRIGAYEVDNVESNSTNVEGKVISDVVNPCYISTFYNLFNNPNELLSYLTDLVNKTSYFKYSTGILEIVDSNGTVLVPGLLRKAKSLEGNDMLDNDGNIIRELTPYYKDFGYSLLDGIENTNTEDGTKYTKLYKKDWNIQSVNAFLNKGNNNNTITINGRNYRKARYNLVTPSDAPKGYYIDGVVIPTNDLISKGIVNKQSLMYKRLQHVLMQELAEMARAVNDIFNVDEDGLIIRDDNGRPSVKANIKDLYKFYHYNGKSLYTMSNDGTIKLTGNVFKFTRLSITRDNIDETNDLNAMDIFASTGGVIISKNGKPSLTPEQSQAIGEFLTKYVLAKAKDAYNNIKEFDSYIPGDKVEQLQGETYKDYVERAKEVRDKELEAIATELVFNYTIQYNEQYNLFVGSPAFYKNLPDTIKRNKETIAGGITNAAYVNMNINSTDEKLGTITIGGREVEIKSTFSYVTIKDPAKASANLEAIERKLEGANENVKNDILSRFGKADDKGNVRTADIADAQSYITLEEFAKRLYLKGELDMYQSLIDKLLDETQPLTELDLYKLNKAIQVQKNFYFDMEMSEFGVLVPNQIKNAEFVLIPRFIKNTGLELLYNTMIENGINQVNMETTEKATRRRIVEVFDETGAITESSISKLSKDADSYVRSGKYARLYLQQDTPQHMMSNNKAGVQIMKKVIDNIPDEHRGLVDQFFELYTDNIEESWFQLADKIGYDLERGEVTDLDKYFRAVRQELLNRNADANMLDYATPKEDGTTLMPASFPSTKKKFEQILNSMFTNSVTRQLLPGFHAAQVSNAGMNRIFKDSDSMSQSEYQATYGNQMKRLNYMASNKDGYDGYVEILLPYWAKDILANGNEATIEELEAAGLTEMLGYRIPTEGKQSIVIMKVVGFLSQAHGSTIVLPDEFVTQTGADFDIDSVYGMYYNTRINRKTGKIEKVPYETDINKLYISYVNRNVDNEINKLVKATYDEINDISYNVLVTSTGFDRLSKGLKSAIKKFHADIKANNITGMDLLNLNNEQYRRILDSELVSDKDKDIIRIMKVDTENMIDNLMKADRKRELYNALTDESKLKEAKRIARENGLLSLNMFTEQNTISKLNSREGRTNKLLDTMIELMKLPSSFVENKSCSNFDIMSAAKVKVESAIAKRGDNSSSTPDIYSVFGQSEYRNRVVSALDLKGISVSLDGLTSILSVSKAYLSEPIYHKVRKDKYDKDTIEKGYKIVDEDDTYYTVKFSRLGWSPNGNLNIDGFLITSYSSQTTANILDNVKDPIISNLTELFGIFKTMLTVGLDYDTASAYIRQPIVDDLATIIKDNNSAFDKSGFNPLIKVELLYLNKLYQSLNGKDRLYKKADLIDAINKINPDIIPQLYTINDNGKYILNSPMPVSTDELMDTLETYTGSTAQLINQFNILANIKNINNQSESISRVNRLLNPDKVGASKGFVESTSMLTKILTYSGTIKVDVEGKPIPVIKAIYPNDGDVFSDKVLESAYPPLFAQLKYSTATSVQVNTPIFDTYTPEFISLKNKLRTNNEEAISKFEDYITVQCMLETPFIKNNTYDDLVANDENQISRIYGINNPPVTEFDITNTSDENIIKYMKLSPANKILLLKKYMKDVNNSLLQYLDYNYNEYSMKDSLFMSIDKDGYEKYYTLFDDMYNNLNPFVKLAAIDLIRYETVRSGFSFKQGSLSHIIPNKYLYDNNVTQGKSLISQYKDNINNLRDDDVYVHNFFRQYTDYSITTVYDNVNYSKQHSRARYKIKFDSDGVAELSTEQLAMLGLYNGGRVSNTRYVITNELNKKDLNKYQVNYVYDHNGDVSKGILIPLNPLEVNENSIISVNPANNKFKSYEKLQYSNFIDKKDIIVTNSMDKLLLELDNINYATLIHSAYGDDFNWSSVSDNYVMGYVKDRKPTNEDILGWIDKARSSNKKLAVPDEYIEDIVNVCIAAKFNNLLVSASNREGRIHLVTRQLNKLNKAINYNSRILSLSTGELDVTDSKTETVLHGLRKSISEYINPSLKKGNNVNKVASILGRGNSFGEIKIKIPTNLGLREGEFIKVSVDTSNLDSNGNNIYSEYIVRSQENSRTRIVTNDKLNSYTYSIQSKDLVPPETRDIGEYYSNIEDAYNALDEALVTVAANVNIEGKVSTRYDEIRVEAKTRLSNLGFDTKMDNELTIDINNRLAAMNVIKDYIVAKSKELTNHMDNFINNYDAGTTVNILDDSIYEAILNGDNTVELTLLRLIHEVGKFSSNYDSLTSVSMTFDTTDLTDTQKSVVNNMKTVLNDIRIAMDNVNAVKTKANKARDKYFTNVVAKLSTNKALLENPDAILDAINDESLITTWVESAFESSRPILQLMLKKIDKEVNKATIDIEDRQNAFDAKMKEFEDKGLTVDDVIEDGRFIMPHDDRFIEKVTTLREAVSDAYKEFGYGSREHDEAKLELSSFLADNVEQEFAKDYYSAMNNIQEILMSNEPARAILRKLNAEMSNILANAIDGDYSTLSDDQLKELSVLRSRKRRLANTHTEDYYAKTSDATDPELNSEVAKTIASYNKAIIDFNNTYKERVVSEEFEELLKHNLDKFRSSREGSKDYLEAERWLMNNTKVEFSTNMLDRINKLYEVLGSNTSAITKTKLMNELLKHRDIANVIDGTSYTEAEVDKVKALQEAGYAKSRDSRVIQANIKPSPVFTNEFYSELESIKGAENAYKKNLIKQINARLKPYVDTSTGELRVDDISSKDLEVLSFYYNRLDNYNITYDNDNNKLISSTKGKTLDGVPLSTKNKEFLDKLESDIDYNKFNSDEVLAKSKGSGYYAKWQRTFTSRSMSKEDTKAMSDMFYNKTNKKDLDAIRKANGAVKMFSDTHGNIIIGSAYSNKALIANTHPLVDVAFKVLVEGNEVHTVADMISANSLTITIGNESHTIDLSKYTTDTDKIKAIQNYILGTDSLRVDNKAINIIKDKGFTVKPTNSYEPSIILDYTKLTFDKNGALVPIGLLNEIVPPSGFETKPNPMVYGAFSTNDKNYINKEATEARDEINKLTEIRPTAYYYKALRDMKDKLSNNEITADEYTKWFDNNHIYNPYNRKLEPIAIWVHKVPSNREDTDFNPNDNWVKLKTKDDYKNDKFVRNQLTINNNSSYKNNKYDAIMNDTNKAALYNYLRETIGEFVVDSKDRFHVNKGYVPTVLSSETQELGFKDRFKTMFGIYDIETPIVHINTEDRKIALPMLYTAGKKPFVKMQPQGTMTDAEYAAYRADVKAQNKQIYKDNEKAHIDAISKDYKNSIREFIKVGTEYQNKLSIDAMFKTLLTQLKNSQYEVRNSENNRMTNLVKSSILGKLIYATEGKSKSNIYNKAEVMYKRYVFNEFEKQAKLGKFNVSKWARVLRSVTSLKTMTFNWDGGVSNILFGLGALNAEVMAGRYFDSETMSKATKEYFKPSTVYDSVRYGDKDTSITLAGAIFKKFGILDTHTESAEQRLKGRNGNKFFTSDKLFIFQSAGEHIMQNITLISVLMSNRIINGKLLTKSQYLESRRIDATVQAIEEIDNTLGTNYATDFNNKLASLRNTNATNKTGRSVATTNYDNLVTEFLRTLPYNVQKQFLKNRTRITKNDKTAYSAYPTMYDQYELKDGQAVIKADSEITNDHTAEIRSKVMAINRTIHGVYDKLGASLTMQYWIGQLVNQFRKHISTAVTKRFKSEYYDEVREAFNKGAYRSFTDFISESFTAEMDRIKDNPVAQSYGTLSTILRSCYNVVAHSVTNYRMMSEVDRAGLRKTMNDAIVLFAGLVLKYLIPKFIAEKPKKDKLAAHVIYWGDRLMGETLIYGPLGAMDEVSSLWNVPAVGLNVLKSMGELGSILFDEITLIGASDKKYKDKMYSKRGVYKGNHKLHIWFKRNTPIYNQYNKFVNKERNLEYVRTTFDKKK